MVVCVFFVRSSERSFGEIRGSGRNICNLMILEVVRRIFRFMGKSYLKKGRLI